MAVSGYGSTLAGKCNNTHLMLSVFQVGTLYGATSAFLEGVEESKVAKTGLPSGLLNWENSVELR